MGLSSFPCAAEGMLPVLVMKTVLSVALLKNLLKSALATMGATSSSSEEEDPSPFLAPGTGSGARKRRISITQFKSLCENHSSGLDRTTTVTAGCDGGSGGGGGLQAIECCVCLNRFEEEEEVSELSCKHFFHRGCLEKWFDNEHTTCPLCRSIH